MQNCLLLSKQKSKRHLSTALSVLTSGIKEADTNKEDKVLDMDKSIAENLKDGMKYLEEKYPKLHFE